MIIDLSVCYRAANGDKGIPERYRMAVDGDRLREVYKAIGQPHGAGRLGMERFLETAVLHSAESLIAIGSFAPMPNIPGYEPVIQVKVIAESERDLAPPEALLAYDYTPSFCDLGYITDNAPDDENGQKWAYHSIICEFWATSKDDVDDCPHGSPGCAAHCPHCGNPLAITPLEEYLSYIKPTKEAHAALMASHAWNCDGECHVFAGMYGDILEKIAKRSKKESELRAKAQESGRYAHLRPDYEPLTAVTCTCGESAVPVALKAQDKPRAAHKWVLTWDCGQHHYAMRGKRTAPWPFVEKYATALDLKCAGFKVVE